MDRDENTPGINPAWQEVLGVIPEDRHEPVTPYFQKWDQSANERITKANESLKVWEPYQPLVDHGIPMDQIHESLQLHQTLMNNPMELYEALQKSYGLSGNEEEESGEEETAPNQVPKEFQQLQGVTKQMAEWIVQQEQEKKHEAENAALDRALEAAKEKYGEFDEAYVLSQMAFKDMSADKAVEEYKKFEESLLQSKPRPFAPNVMGGTSSGSGYPSQQPINPT